MRGRIKLIAISVVSIACFACNSNTSEPGANNKAAVDSSNGGDVSMAVATVSLPAPFATKSVTNYCDVIDWPKEKTPVAPAGFTVTKFADSLDNPRWIYVGPNGDIFIAESETTTSAKDGSLLVADDAANKIWRVSVQK